MPYLQPGSPATQLLGVGSPTSLPLLYRVALPSVLLGFLVASTLNVTALGLTGVAVALGLLGWISLPRAASTAGFAARLHDGRSALAADSG